MSKAPLLTKAAIILASFTGFWVSDADPAKALLCFTVAILIVLIRISDQLDR